MRSSIQSAKTRLETDCGSDHELLIAKFRLELKKVGKTTRQFKPDLSKHVVFFNTEDIIIISIDVNLWPFDTLAIFHSVVFTHIR